MPDCRPFGQSVTAQCGDGVMDAADAATAGSPRGHIRGGRIAAHRQTSRCGRARLEKGGVVLGPNASPSRGLHRHDGVGSGHCHRHLREEATGWPRAYESPGGSATDVRAFLRSMNWKMHPGAQARQGFGSWPLGMPQTEPRPFGLSLDRQIRAICPGEFYTNLPPPNAGSAPNAATAPRQRGGGRRG